ncbi:MAG TPA: hypothetical protein VG738_04150 [Chitinophagaceae bacterium]|nr:hypothetical protein [Chitinophagaceae bacterium]
MKKRTRIIIVVFGLLLLAAGILWYYVFVWSANHHRNVEDEKGIPVTSSRIVSLYEKNEHSADSLFLDKAIQVTGEITSMQVNQQGMPTVTLKSDDPMSSVFCTLKNKHPVLKTGSIVTIKGICTGYLSDVIVIGAVLVNNDN